MIFLCFPGTFKLTLQFTEDYPNKPPTVRFVSRMFHPNSKFETETAHTHVCTYYVCTCIGTYVCTYEQKHVYVH